jgi:hypothetical protein
VGQTIDHTALIEIELAVAHLEEVDQYAAWRGIPRDGALRELILRGLTWSRPFS